MVFKVYYHEPSEEVPVRERTDSLYVEAESVTDVRRKLADRNMNIAHVEKLEEGHLAYEQRSEDFKVEKI
ncbi:DNA-dependent RNA polymerase subunit epsilon [Salirhabdus salicampi]|uniref:DNA-dependent RNA polymerase subunit epsilon n=1 Tax=Salirhabdus salicampi TaxID=476102 RepID=UPI0020C2D599|nr:RNA polymerase epsilon subunit [Salirhabdus salicampi]MCP8616056.1 DNA-directed RNA polymerase subunit epsilon [Salirhabdus salicampi]